MIREIKDFNNCKLAELLSGTLTHKALTPELSKILCTALRLDGTEPETIQAALNVQKGYLRKNDSGVSINERSENLTSGTISADRQMSFEDIKEFFCNVAWNKTESAYVIDGLIYLLKTLESKFSRDDLDCLNFIDNLMSFIYHDMSLHGSASYYKYRDNIDRRFNAGNYGSSEYDESIEAEINGQNSNESEKEETESPETYERFSHSRELADENKAYQLAAGLLNHPDLDTKSQRKLFQFMTENSILNEGDLQEISMVTGIEHKPQNEYLGLATHISAVLNDRRTPKILRDGLSDAIAQVNLDRQLEITDSPEYIAQILVPEAGNVG